MATKYIFVTGGVTSSLGKGIIAASLGKLLQARGYRVTNQKLDPKKLLNTYNKHGRKILESMLNLQILNGQHSLMNAKVETSKSVVQVG